MAGLKQIKTKIRSVEKSRQVTKAMEAVSAVKMRKAQQRALAGRAYARAATEVLARVAGSRELANHPLTAQRSHERVLYVVITSDKGLAGALNSAVLRAVQRDMQPFAATAVSVIAVGRKAHDFFVNQGIERVSYHPNTDQVTSEVITSIVDEAARAFSGNAVDVVKIAYQNFKSTFEQRPTIRTVFPLSLEELAAVVGDIVPKAGKYAELDVHQNSKLDYTIEPSAEGVLNAIVPRLASIFVYHALLESQASEHSARMVAMKSASDKAGDLRRSLTISFNKARQAAITREVSEITGGMEAMAA